MANISDKVAQIRQAVYGKDVRESIASSIEAINSEVETTTAKQAQLDTTFEQLIINAGNSNAEIVDARGGFNTLRKKLDSYAINVRDFGAKGDGVTDDTQAFKAAIIYAYNLAPEISGWKSPMKIFIPPGNYIVSDTLINQSMNLYGARFVFEGSGYQSTHIYFTANEEKFLFDNNQIFGFTLFRGIHFIGNYVNSFMNAVGGGTGNCQSLFFENCSFRRFKYLMYVTGDTMVSEITFYNCKISDFNTDSVIFSLKNSQSVNWRFYATDIESFRGVLFDYIYGASIYYYQGSIIPIDGCVIRINETADPNKFGSTNSPIFTAYGVRFELRGYSFLIKNLRRSTIPRICFYNCGMGGYNLTTDASHFPIYLIGSARIIFDACENFDNYKAYFYIAGESYYVNQQSFIEFRNNGPSNSFISNSVIEGTNLYTYGAYPYINFVNCGLNTRIQLKGYDGYRYSFDNLKIVSEHMVRFSATDGNFYFAPFNTSKTFTIDLPSVELYEIKIKILGNPGKNYDFNIQVYDEEKSVTFINENFNASQSKEVITTICYHRFSINGQLKVKFTPITISPNYVQVLGYMTLKY